MAIRTIRTDEDPILRKKAKTVIKFDDKLKTLVEDMIETMHEAEGVGLAAPQIGILKRIVVIDLYDDEGPIAFINPVMLEVSGTQCEEEGCLSLPGRTGYVNRPTHMVVSFQDERGEFYELEADEFLARVLSHELDHLEGILYIDKMVDMPKKENEA